MSERPEWRQAGIDETMMLMRNTAEMTANKPGDPVEDGPSAPKSLLTGKRVRSPVKSSSDTARDGVRHLGHLLVRGHAVLYATLVVSSTWPL